MPRYLVRFDTPIQLLHDCADAPAVEIAGFDDIPLRWVKTGEQTVGEQRRHYYASCPPYRVLVVCQNGHDLHSFQSTPDQPVYATALVGWDDGAKGYVLPGQEGKRHTKISLLMRFTGGQLQQSTAHADLERIAWSELLRGAPRTDRPGGYRGTQGRPALDTDEEIVSVRASVPASYAVVLDELGDGNTSKGVRRAVEIVIESRKENQ